MKRFLVLSLSMIFMNMYAQQPKQPPVLPALKSMEAFDTLHGVVVHDPYRGLEDTENLQVHQWLRQQRQYTDSLLGSHDIYDTLQQELAYYQHMAEHEISFPIAVDTTLFYVKRMSSNNKQQLMMREGFQGDETVLYEISSQTIEFFAPSPTKKHVVIALTSQGREVSTLYIYDISQGRLLQDSIPRNLLSLPEWLPDGSGFFYQQPSDTDNIQERFLYSQVKLHYLGTPATTDQIILSSQDNDFIQPHHFPYINLYPNSTNVLASVYEGTDFNASLYMARVEEVLSNQPIHWRRITTPEDQVTSFALVGNLLYLITTKYQESGEIIAIPAAASGLEQRETVMSLDSAIIDEFLLTRSGLYIKAIDKGISAIYRYDIDSKKTNKIEVPVEGKITINDFYRPITYMNIQGLLIGAESWTQPYGLYYYDPTQEVTSAIDVHLNNNYLIDLVVEQVHATSYDGVKIPLTIIHEKGLKKGKDHPTLLFAYGSHGLSVEPAFNPLFVPWYKRGGIFAVAHVRGGGEKGKQWHDAGRLSNKPNSWKDFIACAKLLIEQQYTSPDHLAAYGASAGAITIGRAITSAPDLFQAAVIKVGVMNPLRFEETGNTANTTEFGSYKNPEQFPYLLEMDSYHHVKKGIHYPAMLFTAGLNDNRVAVWQPGKMVARLQDINKTAATLLYVQDESGHFGGENQEAIHENTTIFTFLFWQLRATNPHEEQ